jgi:hypothetical protein
MCRMHCTGNVLCLAGMRTAAAPLALHVLSAQLCTPHSGCFTCLESVFASATWRHSRQVTGAPFKPPTLQTCASHSFSYLCRFYQKLAGMTGTARSAAAEFYEIYGLRVVPIPTNKPPRRKDMPLRLYYTEQVGRNKFGMQECYCSRY